MGRQLEWCSTAEVSLPCPWTWLLWGRVCRSTAGHCPHPCPQGGLGRLLEIRAQPCQVTAHQQQGAAEAAIPLPPEVPSLPVCLGTQNQLSGVKKATGPCSVHPWPLGEVSGEQCWLLRGKRNEHLSLSWRSCRITRAVGFPVVQKEHLLVCTSLGIQLYLTASLQRTRALVKQNTGVAVSCP